MHATHVPALAALIADPMTAARGWSQWLVRLATRRSAVVRSSTPALQHVAKGATLWIARPRGRCIRCASGTLWLCFDGEQVDIVLEAGESHRCRSGSRLSIHALAAAAVRSA